MTFLQTIAAIMNGQGVIEGLKDDQLSACCNGVSIDRSKIPGKLLRKIARLQTLIEIERERGEVPMVNYTEAPNQTSYNKKLSEGIALANAYCVRRDVEHRIQALQQLIVEIVREAYPPECDRFGVNYGVNPDNQIICWVRPDPCRRSLD